VKGGIPVFAPCGKEAPFASTVEPVEQKKKKPLGVSKSFFILFANGEGDGKYMKFI